MMMMMMMMMEMTMMMMMIMIFRMMMSLYISLKFITLLAKKGFVLQQCSIQNRLILRLQSKHKANKFPRLSLAPGGVCE